MPQNLDILVEKEVKRQMKVRKNLEYQFLKSKDKETKERKKKIRP